MGLHFIKNGTKHDVCVKRPSLFPASATTYDNSQSGLAATRVQGAIDEVNEKVDGKVLAEVTGNGAKSFGTLFAELAGLLDFSKVTVKSVMKIGGAVYACGSVSSTIVTYTNAVATSNNFSATRIVLGASNSIFTNTITAGPTVAFTDRASEVVGNGTVIRIYA
jgi:hypothetical protein